MARYVALLRGINLGSRNRLKMADLKAAFESIGYTNTATYLQSGNIAFNTDETEALAQSIHGLLRQHFNLDIPVVVRSQAEIVAAIKAQPFSTESSAWHVTFLAARPQSDLFASIAPKLGADTWHAVGRDIYLNIPGSYAKTKFQNALFEQKLGTVATTRNWKTVLALAEL